MIEGRGAALGIELANGGYGFFYVFAGNKTSCQLLEKAEMGGKVFQPTIGAALDKAFDAILRDLRTQYLLGYYPKSVALTRDRFHTVKVETTIPGRRVQTRNGYYGDALP